MIPPPRPQQRREFFRMRVRLGLCIRSAPANAPSPESGPVRILPLIDLSGGGCLCADPDATIPVGARVYARVDLGDDEPAIEFEALAVRRTTVEEAGAVGLRFTSIRERDRERLLRYLFRAYRRERLARTGN